VYTRRRSVVAGGAGQRRGVASAYFGRYVSVPSKIADKGKMKIRK
jgi:hypothetical protein